jgi:type II secretory ATPase GspE/PulE/Tfp pilus assembly ATPase PilB-like protein
MNEAVREALRQHDYTEGTLQAASRDASVFDPPGHAPRLPLANMLQDGLRKCTAGLTSLEEVLTVIE